MYGIFLVNRVYKNNGSFIFLFLIIIIIIFQSMALLSNFAKATFIWHWHMNAYYAVKLWSIPLSYGYLKFFLYWGCLNGFKIFIEVAYGYFKELLLGTVLCCIQSTESSLVNMYTWIVIIRLAHVLCSSITFNNYFWKSFYGFRWRQLQICVCFMTSTKSRSPNVFKLLIDILVFCC